MILVCSLICGGQRRQIVVPVAVGNRAILHAARSRQHLETDERRLGGEHLVFVAQERADDVGHDAFRPAAGDDVFHLEIELARQHFAQVEPAVGIEIELRAAVPHGFDRQRRRAQRVFVRRQLNGVRDPVGALDIFGAAAGLVGVERRDVGWNQGHGGALTSMLIRRY